MNKIAYISVIKYHPSYVLNEEINIGLLFILPEESKCELLYPKDLSRAKLLFPDASIEFIRSGLEFRKDIANNCVVPAYFGDSENVNWFVQSLFPKNAVSIVFSGANPAIYENGTELFARNMKLFFNE